MGEPSSFTISTLPDAQVSHSLDLRGRALPYRPFDLEGTMRAEFTWYPGNAVASLQMLGAEEKPTVLKGKWKDRFLMSQTDEGKSVQPTAIALYNGQQVSDVATLAALVETMRLAGQLLEVRWDQQVRQGILMRFRQSWDRIEDLDWEMEFQWVSRGETQRPPSVGLNPTASDFSTQLSNYVDQLKTAMSPPQFQVVGDFSDQISGYASEIDDAALEVSNAAQNSIAQVTSPQAAQQRALTSMESVRQSASGIVSAIEQTPAQMVINTPLDTQTMSDALAALSWMLDIKDAAQQLLVFASAEADTLKQKTDQQELLAIFTARAPTDLRDVSTEFYGTPENWASLMTYNDLDSSLLRVGQVIQVPKLSEVTS